MEEKPFGSLIEPRWPIIVTVLIVMALLLIQPNRIRLLPGWFIYVLVAGLLVPMVMVSIMGATTKYVRLEQTMTFLFCIIGGGGNLISLAYLVQEMISSSQAISGLQLLASSVAVGVTNILVFSLLYWQVDQAGPVVRLMHNGHRPDWLFTQSNLPEEIHANWHPIYVDYLFLAFTTATAFSPTDTLPITPRAKLLMMLESTISLMTIVVVAARAINLIGS